MAQQQGQQYIILKEGSSRTRGRDAQGMNLMAARAVAEAVRTTLGPKGMDKMLVDSLGDVVITNDGVTILKEMDIEHPAAKMIVEIAKTQDDEVGDGTTTAVVFAGELLKKSEALLDMDVHPTVIASGYRQAAAKAREILDALAYPVTHQGRGPAQEVRDHRHDRQGPGGRSARSWPTSWSGPSRPSLTRTARSTSTTSRSRRRSAAPSAIPN